MSKEKLNAKLDQTKGAIKEGIGKITRDKETETEGFVEKTVAKGKEAIDDAKESTEGVLKGIKKSFKKLS